MPTDKPLTTYEPPPATPPEVSINGVVVDITAYDWEIDGERRSYRSAVRQEDVILQRIEHHSADPVVITIGSAQKPSQFILSYFTELDDRGIPRSSVEGEVDCLKDGRCKYFPTMSGGLEAHVSVPEDTKIAVLHLGYTSLNLEREQKARMLMASWGVRLSQTT